MAENAVPSAPSGFAVRCAFAYAAAMSVNGILLPFFPAWLKSLSLNEFEIGVILTVPIILRLVSAPLAGVLADRIAERVFVLIVSAALSLITALLLIWAGGFWTVLIIFSLQGATFAPFMPVLESITVMGVRRWGFRYGTIRVWGSIGFVVSTLIAGWAISHLSGRIVPEATALTYLLTLSAALMAPRLGRAMRAPTAPTADTTGMRQMARLPFRSSLNLLMIGCTIVQSTHGMYYAFSGIYWQGIGFSGQEIGILWASGVIAEILFFFCAGRIVRHISAVSLILIGSVAAVIRWSLFVTPLSFEASVLLQCSHALSFAFLHFGMQQKIVEVVHESQESSIQGTFFFYNGAFLAASTFLSGLIYHSLGQHSYYVMSAVAAFGLLITLTVSRRAWKA
ncbi:MFS transporter [Rhizobium sp. FKY42]|uniref:MFS transporter n=1 Tax=Rhizobium sp. FKY42 TaxID=2562310 RepID=UPI001485A341|nr:MFS transporter [Rhizobium sp. FKY42]